MTAPTITEKNRPSTVDDARLGVELKKHIIKLNYPSESFPMSIRNRHLRVAMHLIMTRYFNKIVRPNREKTAKTLRRTLVKYPYFSSYTVSLREWASIAQPHSMFRIWSSYHDYLRPRAPSHPQNTEYRFRATFFKNYIFGLLASKNMKINQNLEIDFPPHAKTFPIGKVKIWTEDYEKPTQLEYIQRETHSTI